MLENTLNVNISYVTTNAATLGGLNPRHKFVL